MTAFRLMLTRSLVAFLASVFAFFGVTLDSITPNEYDALADGADIRVVSYNVKIHDWYSVIGHYNLYTSSVRLAAQLLELDADSIGTQEMTYEKLQLFEEYLEGYSYVGENRGGANASFEEYCTIFYKTDKYNLLDYGTFWLSDTPDTESKISGSYYNRICTWVLLENKETGECYVHANTHLDNSTDKVRAKQFAILVEQLGELGLLDYPLVITGDFNTESLSAFSDTMTAASLSNTRTASPVTDDSVTYNSWGMSIGTKILDYALVDSGFTPVVYKVVSSYIDGKWASDHNAIYVDLSFN